MSDILALSHCHITHDSAQGANYGVGLGTSPRRLESPTSTLKLSLHSLSQPQRGGQRSNQKERWRTSLSNNSQHLMPASSPRSRVLSTQADSSRVQAYNEEFEVNYEVRVQNKVFGFYGPYVSQKPIAPASLTGQQREFTIATADLGHSNNWVVCEVVNKLKTRCKLDPGEERCESGESHQGSSELEVEVLRKVGVLRTDFCGEILAGGGDDSPLRRIHALFV